LSFAAAFALCRLAADFAFAFQLLLNIETCRFSRKGKCLLENQQTASLTGLNVVSVASEFAFQI